MPTEKFILGGIHDVEMMPEASLSILRELTHTFDAGDDPEKSPSRGAAEGDVDEVLPPNMYMV